MRPRKRVGSADESHRFSSQASYGGLSFTLVFPFSSAIPRLRETPSTLSTEHEIQKCLDHVSHARHGKIRGLVSATTGGLHQGSFSSAPKGYILHSESQSQEIEHQNDHLVDTRRVSSLAKQIECLAVVILRGATIYSSLDFSSAWITECNFF
jgi:hypothetical protein